jgi:subtilase family serine protease
MIRDAAQARNRRARLRTRRRTGRLLGAVIGPAVVVALAAGAGAGPAVASSSALTAPSARTSPSPRLAVGGAAPRLPAGTRVLRPAPGSARLQVTLALRSRDPAGLASLARQVSMPAAARFRRFLGPRQVRARFGAPPAVLTALRSWLRGQGLTVRPTSGDGLLIPVTGSVRDLEAAFRTPIRRVRLAGGRVAHVNSRPASVPARSRPWVAAVVGLDNLVMPRPDLTVQPGVTRSTPAHSTPAHSTPASRPSSGGPRACPAARATPATFTAHQIAHAYSFGSLYRQGTLGHGVTVALFELASYARHDIATYERCYRISPSIRRVHIDGGTTIRANPDGTVEATADIETLTGMAPRAKVLVYEAPAARGLVSLLDNYGAIAQQDKAQVVSSSYGICEPLMKAGKVNVARIEARTFEMMAVQGQSMLAASGDAGSEQCLPNLAQLHGKPVAYQLEVGDPASQPDVTAVGGTAITQYGSPPGQTAWNQSGPSHGGTGYPAPFDGRDGRPAGYPGNMVGSGGISTFWGMPSWQRGFDASGNSSGSPCGAPRGTDCREVPDVSALAAGGQRSTPGYAVYGTAGDFHGRGWISVGGTSLATPLWAALTALADQRTPGHRLGLLSPALYRIRQLDPGTFTDVTVGDNNYLAPGGSPVHDTCTYQGAPNQPCYQATPGYDMATGLGSPQARLLVAALAHQ